MTTSPYCSITSTNIETAQGSGIRNIYLENTAFTVLITNHKRNENNYL